MAEPAQTTGDGPIDPLKLASVLLQYPTAEAQEAIRALDDDERRALGRSGGGLAGFLAWYARIELGELQRDYVETFDFAKQRSLHLTYHQHGDRRQRGIAMLELKRAYGEAGFDVTGSDLPDYLPIMLEFAALAPDGAGRDLLDRNRVGIELVRSSLARDGSPWLALLELVSAGLPGLTGRQLGRIRRLAAEGPPSEDVGLEPFAPPDVMPPGASRSPRPSVGGGR